MNIRQFFGLVLSAVVLFACGGTDFKKTRGGAPYKVFSKGSGEKIAKGDIVKFHITQKIKDSLLSTTYGQFPRYERVDLPASGAYDIRSIVMETLMNATKDDSIYILISMDSFIKRDPSIVQNTPFRKGDQLITTIRVVDVFKNEQAAQQDVEKESKAVFNNDPKIQAQKAKDEKAIQDYLAANNIKAEKTEWGTFMQVQNPGQGPKPQPGEFALVRYTGTDFSGKVFDTNNKPGAQLYPLRIGSGGSIMGFEDAVRQLGKGGKARVYVPSVLAYGEMGNPPVIQPNQNLIFDIEVADITKDAPAQQMPPVQPPVDTTKK